MNLDGLSLKLSLEPRKKIGDCVLARAGARKRCKCAVVDGMLFTLPTTPSTLGSAFADDILIVLRATSPPATVLPPTRLVCLFGDTLAVLSQ